MTAARYLIGFHAVASRLRQRAEGVQAIYLTAARHDHRARARQQIRRPVLRRREGVEGVGVGDADDGGARLERQRLELLRRARRKLGHCSGCREAGSICGWPARDATRPRTPRCVVVRVVSSVNFEAVLAGLPDAVIAVDTDGRVVFWNAAAEELIARAHQLRHLHGGEPHAPGGAQHQCRR